MISDEFDSQFSLRHSLMTGPQWVAEHLPSGCFGQGTTPTAALLDLAVAMAELANALQGHRLGEHMASVQRALTAPTARSFVATMADAEMQP